MFSLTLIDSFSDEIQATFFNSAVDLFYETFKDGAVYTFSNGEIKSAKRKYNSTENEYQISFDSNSIISEVSDDGSIGFLKFNFVPIDQLPKIDIGTIVDVCGRITEISPVSNIFSRKGENLHKRTVKITDHTLHSIEITLWNDLANLPELENLNLESLPILAAKSLKLTNFNIMSLTCDKSVSSIHINPKNFQELEFFEK